MSTDFKRTFLAGGAVLLILLIAPYYLQLIGYKDEIKNAEIDNNEVDIVQTQEGEALIANKPISNEPNSFSNNKQAENTQINIENKKYSAVLNNVGGGSLLQYQLINGGKQLQGAYDLRGAYSDSVDVDMILNNQKQCAPCVGVQKNNQPVVFSEPFEISKITETLFLPM